MIKVNFKEHQLVRDFDNKYSFDCLFVLCNSFRYFFADGFDDFNSKESLFIHNKELLISKYQFNNIKSIEHVKPTDL